MTQRSASTRREFLQGKAAARALADAADGALAEPISLASSSDATQGTYLLRFTRQAMACTFEICLNAGQYGDGSEAALSALDLVDQLEDQLTVFRPHSEVCRINREAGYRPVEVEPRLFALLEEARHLHEQTAGAFDITAGALSEVWGFTRRAGRMPAPQDVALALTRVGGREIELDTARRQVRFLREGLQINLGAIGKGYALDRCAELLEAAGVHDYLLHGGHSSVLARGAHGAAPPEGGWTVGIRNPLRPAIRLGQLNVRDRAIATSGSGTQFFEHEGRRYGHILDPRTGWPAQNVLAVTVLAPTAATADALSTAFYVLGLEGARRYCEAHADIGCVLSVPGSKRGTLDVHTLGLAAGEWSPAADAASCTV